MLPIRLATPCIGLPFHSSPHVIRISPDPCARNTLQKQWPGAATAVTLEVVILSATGLRLAAATPNLLSGLRLLLAATFSILPPQWWAATILLSAVTDLLDGMIARRFGFTSWQGGLLDATADKLFVLAVLATFTLAGELTIPATTLLLLRDLAVTMIFLYIVVRQRRDALRNMPSRLLGKSATAAIYLFLFAMALQIHVGAIASILPGVYVGAAALVIAAAIDYTIVFARSLQSDTVSTTRPR